MTSILIWSQASKYIGAGHVHRCHTLAVAIKQLIPETKVSWVAEDTTLATQAWLKETGVIDAWVPLTELYLTSGYDWAILDDYRCQAEDEAALRTVAKKIMVIEDQPNRSHDADLLLDQSLERHDIEYKAKVPPGCKLVLGSEYVLLRPEFSALREKAIERRKTTHKVSQVLVSVGATDPLGLTLKILSQLEASPQSFSVKAVVSSLVPNLEAIQTLADSSARKMTLIIDTLDMAEKMLEADLAIGAAGMTTWERAALGLPSVLFQVADNQSDNIKKIIECKMAEVCTTPMALETGEFLSKFHKLFDSAEQRNRFSLEGFKRIDGLGAQKVAQKLLA